MNAVLEARDANRLKWQARLTEKRDARTSIRSGQDRVSRNLLARSEQIIPIQQVRNRKAVKMTGAARCASGSGKRSLWSASQNYKTAVTIDARWSK